MAIRNSRCWDVNPAASLDEVLSWCLSSRQVDRLIVVADMRSEAPVPPLVAPKTESTIAEVFGARVIRSELATAWPGTVRLKGAAKVFVIEFDDTVKKRMVDVQNKLFEWRPRNVPPLPEDVCVYRVGDPMPTLVSVSHEGEAWFCHDGPIDRSLATPSDDPEFLTGTPPAPLFYVPL